MEVTIVRLGSSGIEKEPFSVIGGVVIKTKVTTGES